MLTKVTSGKNALHGVFRRVLIGGGARLVARSAQVIVDANQTFVPSTSEIVFQTGVTADSCLKNMICTLLSKVRNTDI